MTNRGGTDRELSEREQDVLIALVELGADHTASTTAADRARWLARVPGVRAGERCGCGTCPSVALTHAQGRTPSGERCRVVLEGRTAGALLLLFLDGDAPSFLELAPLDDQRWPEFPPVDAFDLP